jgi:hypothetical protein
MTGAEVRMLIDYKDSPMPRRPQHGATSVGTSAPTSIRWTTARWNA